MKKRHCLVLLAMLKKKVPMSEEARRIKEMGEGVVPPWQKWGPFVSERAWGTVREDYSWNGDAWNYFPFEIAHQKAYRWGKMGLLAGVTVTRF